MGKKRVRHSQNKSITHDKGDHNVEDRISKLPDDIIVSILSRVTLKEAAITSVLSSRWRYLWTRVTRLMFDSDEALDRIASEPKLRNVERSKYINWVNRVMRQHRGPTIQIFTICFDLDKTSKCAIDIWIKFAIAKGVQGLKLDLLENIFNQSLPSQIYTIRYQLLERMKPTGTFDGFKCLRSLLFKGVNVSSNVLEYLLSNCTLLEYLSIDASDDLVDVRIVGSSLRLKQLEIVYCDQIDKIEICDANLVSFSYLGEEINLILNNVPKLEKVMIGGGNSGLEKKVFGQLSCCLSQLLVLTLDLLLPEGNSSFLVIPEFPKLRKLKLQVGAWDDDSLLELTTPLIKACPCLERFLLELFWVRPSKSRREVRKAKNCSLQHLKSVEVYGYYGRVSDFELVMHFIENAVSLRRIVIDPRNQYIERSPVKTAEKEREEAVRRDAKKQLGAIKPSGVLLEIL